MVLPLIYDNLAGPETFTYWGLIGVKTSMEGNWGFVNIQGDTVIPFEYQELGEFDTAHGLCVVEKNGERFAIDKTGARAAPPGSFIDFDGQPKDFRHGYECDPRNIVTTSDRCIRRPVWASLSGYSQLDDDI